MVPTNHDRLTEVKSSLCPGESSGSGTGTAIPGSVRFERGLSFGYSMGFGFGGFGFSFQFGRGTGLGKDLLPLPILLPSSDII